LENPSGGNLKDYLEYTMTINKDAKDERKHIVSASPIKFEKGRHMDKTMTTFAPKEFRRDLNGSPMQYQAREIAVAPGLIEKGFATNENFFKLSDGFKRVVINDA